MYDIDGHLLGTDSFGVYEELEALDRLTPACQLSSLPFRELEKFLLIAHEIGRIPSFLYYIMAYRLTKLHVFSRLKEALTGSGESAFALFEKMFIRGRLINHEYLKLQLRSLANQFAERYKDQFRLERE